MGKGYAFTCKDCGEEYNAQIGIGYFYPLDYEVTVETIKAGGYGKEWKDAFHEHPYTAVDAERHIYECEKCGHWEVRAGLSLYVPKDAETVIRKQSDPMTTRMTKEIAFAMPSDLNEDYTVLKERVHACPACGAAMRRLHESALKSLRCPHCGGEPKEDAQLVLWD